MNAEHGPPVSFAEISVRQQRGPWSGYPSHHHAIHQCYVAFENNLQVTTDQKTHIVQPGQLLIVQPNVTRSVNGIAAGARLDYGLALFRDHALDLTALGTHVYALADYHLLEHLKKDMLRHQDPLAAWSAESLLVHMLIRLRRDHGSGAPSADQALVQQVDHLLWSQMAEAPTRATLAMMLGCSESHLARRYKSAAGISIHQRNARLRLQRAQTLLRQSDLSIRNIATELGLQSPSRFSAWFQRETGKKPSQWRLE